MQSTAGSLTLWVLCTWLGRVYDALAARTDQLEEGAGALERRTLRAATLLHDIGHAPFSHTAETLFDAPIDHEEMTRRLLESSEMQELFETHGNGVTVAAVCDLLSGRASAKEGSAHLSGRASAKEGSAHLRILEQIISGELDVDKMDYLMRDSLYCGVHYGTYDLERVLDTLWPLEDHETGAWGLGLDAGGLHAAEALVLARYYMFTQVYFNVTGKVLELHLNAFLEDEGIQWFTDPDQFLEQDDIWVFHRMKASRSRHADALLRRKRFTLAYESREHLSSEDERAFRKLLQPLEDEFGKQMLVSHSAKDPHKLSRSRVLVRRHNGQLERLEQASHIMARLDRINCFRIYCEPSLKQALTARLQASAE